MCLNVEIRVLFLSIFCKPRAISESRCQNHWKYGVWGFPASSETQKSIKSLIFQRLGEWLSRSWGISACLPELGGVVGKTHLGHFQCGSFQELGTGAHPFFGELGRGCRHLLPSQSLSNGISGIQDGVQAEGVVTQSAINALTQEQGWKFNLIMIKKGGKLGLDNDDEFIGGELGYLILLKSWLGMR